jgi:predicted lipid-binding transport protein (Tim44 family)
MEDYVAVVHFSGTMRTNGGEPEAFEEIWNLVKPVSGRSGWLLGGIQQLN